MKIELIREYKSLSEFESEELPDFVVITGKNGSGKTQLLELIAQYSANRNQILKLSPTIRIIQPEGIPSANLNQINKQEWDKLVQNIWNKWVQLDTSARILLSGIKEIGSNVLYIQDLELFKQAFNKVRKYFPRNKKDKFIWPDAKLFEFDDSEQLYKLLDNGISLKKFEDQFELFSRISDYWNKPIKDLRIQDLSRSEIDAVYVDSKMLFNSFFSRICYAYAYNRYNNSHRFFRKNMSWEENDSISESEFDKQNSPPWEIFNEVLSTTGINYYIQGVGPDEFLPEEPLTLRLKKKSTDADVPISQLSAGETMIFGLVMKLFTSNHYGNKISYPDLITLDEPDAYLHPELTDLLIKVLNDTFVENLGIKVIITSHSPSTIALAPEESIFELKNLGDCSLKWIGRDKALELLTGSIPTLSIDYKNHKQVFVESPTDKYFYQSFFNTLKVEGHKFDSPLYFISNSMGRGNSAQVIDTIKQIREAGNNTCFGIIDWDQKNEPEKFVFVHGKSKRHTIENYLLDPIYIGYLFLKNDGAENILELMGFTKETRLSKLIELNKSELQKVSTGILSKIEARFTVLKKRNTLKEVNYLKENTKIKFPEWFLLMKHEELIEKYRETFPFFAKFTNEGELQEEMTKIVCQCYPLVPLDTVELLTKISNGK